MLIKNVPNVDDMIATIASINITKIDFGTYLWNHPSERPKKLPEHAVEFMALAKFEGDQAQRTYNGFFLIEKIEIESKALPRKFTPALLEDKLILSIFNIITQNAHTIVDEAGMLRIKQDVRVISATRGWTMETAIKKAVERWLVQAIPFDGS